MRNKIEWGKEDEHKEKTEYFCFGFAIGTHAFISTFNALQNSFLSVKKP